MKIVSVKAFGDFVIAANAISRLNQKENPTGIIAGRHLEALAEALNIKHLIQFVDIGENDVPAIFTLKKSGVTAGLISLLRLKHQLSEVDPSSDFIFDQIGWREMFVGYGRKIHSLPKSSTNIYDAYSDFFKIDRAGCKNQGKVKLTDVAEFTIIPSSRQLAKTIPDRLIQKICEEVEKIGARANIVYLEGENCALHSGLKVEKIPRSFSALINKIKESTIVISADSLPAHLCYYLNIPVFVFTPNLDLAKYWAPKSCFINNSIASFDNITDFSDWLRSLSRG